MKRIHLLHWPTALVVLACLAGEDVARAQSTPLFGLSNTWAYTQTESFSDSGWAQVGFDDSGWRQGQGLLARETNPAIAPLVRTPLTIGRTTYYFRTTFEWPFSPLGVSLVVTGRVDDGCVIYLNGTEVKRLRMPEEGVEITYDTFAASLPPGDDAVNNDVFVLLAPTIKGALNSGPNVLAAEVHQINSGSSDIVFGLALAAVLPDGELPVPLSAAMVAPTRVGLCFNTLLDPEPAENPRNYQVFGISPLSAILRPDGRSVELLLSAPLLGASVEISGLRSAWGGPDSLPVTIEAPLWLADAADIGGATPPGSSFSCRPGEVDMIAGGADIWDAADQFQFAYQVHAGDFDVRVRVQRLDVAHIWSKAGLMARETLDAGSKAIHIETAPGGAGINSYEAGVRRAVGNLTEDWGERPPTAIPNAWLRLTRAGQLFTGFHSINGEQWTEFAQTDASANPFSDSLLIGLAATSHHTAQTTVAEFRDYRLCSGESPQIIVQPVSQVSPYFATVTFSVIALGASTYQWFHDGDPIFGATSASLTLTNVQRPQTGLYYVVAGHGCPVRSDTAELQVCLTTLGAPFPGVIATTRVSDLFPFELGGGGLAHGGGGALVAAALLPPNVSLAHGVPVFFTTRNGTNETGRIICGSPSTHTKWVGHVPLRAQSLRISTEGSDFDTVLAVYTNRLGILQQVGCDRDSANPAAVVVIPALTNVLYYIAVDGQNGQTGVVRLQIGDSSIQNAFANRSNDTFNFELVFRPNRPIRVRVARIFDDRLTNWNNTAIWAPWFQQASTTDWVQLYSLPGLTNFPARLVGAQER